jgi:CRISPR-associated protein Cas2
MGGFMKAADYVVVYDISGDKERRRIDKVLKGFGTRAQKSVFECRLNKSGKKDLIRKLEEENGVKP